MDYADDWYTGRRRVDVTFGTVKSGMEGRGPAVTVRAPAPTYQLHIAIRAALPLPGWLRGPAV